MDRRGGSVWGVGGVLLAVAGPVGAATPVQVVLDMDAARPGLQSNVNVSAATTVVNGVAVYVADPDGLHALFGVGYLGGIDRGVAFGHMPGDGNHGTIECFDAHLGTPLNGGNFAVVYGPPGLDPGFIGPEVQYVEGGAAEPAFIPVSPAAPIFTVDITLAGIEAGDVFEFYLLDQVVVWSGGAGGAFSTRAHLSLDSGGDSVPDNTLTIHGVDPDTPLPVPPGTFLVDYVDGPPEGGPATITILPVGDLDGDGVVGILDLLELLAAWGPCTAPCPPQCAADLDGDCNVEINDFLAVLANWS